MNCCASYRVIKLETYMVKKVRRSWLIFEQIGVFGLVEQLGTKKAYFLVLNGYKNEIGIVISKDIDKNYTRPPPRI